MSRRHLVVGWLAGALLWSPAASAQPSLWDVARDPGLARAHDALVAAESSLVRAADSPSGSGRWRRHLRAAVERLGAQSDGPDPRVRFLLAEVLVELGAAWDREVRQLLERPLAEHGAPSLQADGWEVLGLSAARLGDRELECEAYDRALELVWQRERRAHLRYNRADAKLGLGRLAEALVDYRAAARLAHDPDRQALAYYGIGITLERQGDLPGSLRAMRFARKLQPPSRASTVLDDPRVFFVPEYDLYYYQALEAMALAEPAEDAEAGREAWQAAVAYWTRFLLEAEPAEDRWAGNAARHLARCEQELERLDRPRVGP